MDLKAELQKKVGPLPGWAWAAIVTVAGVYWYYRHAQSSAASSTGAGTTGFDANAIDPATGLTYAQESSMAQSGVDPLTGIPYAQEAGGGSGASPSGGAGTTGDSSTPQGTLAGNDLSGELTDLGTIAGLFTQLQQTFGGGGSGPNSGGGDGSGGGGSTVDPAQAGPLTALAATITSGATNVRQVPIATQLALARAGLLTPAQLGPNAKRAFDAGGVKTPAKTTTQKPKAPAKPNRRAPAHPNENHVAPAGSHHTPPPAHTRITTKKPAPAKKPPAKKARR